jgi:hypothetical protein
MVPEQVSIENCGGVTRNAAIKNRIGFSKRMRRLLLDALNMLFQHSAVIQKDDNLIIQRHYLHKMPLLSDSHLNSLDLDNQSILKIYHIQINGDEIQNNLLA